MRLKRKLTSRAFNRVSAQENSTLKISTFKQLYMPPKKCPAKISESNNSILHNNMLKICCPNPIQCAGMGPTRESRGAKDSSWLATGTNMNMFWVLTNLLLGHTHTHTHTHTRTHRKRVMSSGACKIQPLEWHQYWIHGTLVHKVSIHLTDLILFKTVCHVDMSHRLWMAEYFAHKRKLMNNWWW